MFLFPSSSLLTAEYDKVKAILLDNCISPLGKNKIKNLFPQSDFNHLKTELLRTKEFKSILDAAENFPDSDYKDLSKELTLLKIENSVLQTHQLTDVLLCSRTTKEIFSFFKKYIIILCKCRDT